MQKIQAFYNHYNHYISISPPKGTLPFNFTYHLLKNRTYLNLIIQVLIKKLYFISSNK